MHHHFTELADSHKLLVLKSTYICTPSEVWLKHQLPIPNFVKHKIVGTI